MPRTRRTFKRKTRRRTFKKKIRFSRPMKLALKKVIYQSGEKKYLMTDSGGVINNTTTAVFADVSLIPQGDGDSQRTGDQTNLRSVDFRYIVRNSSGIPSTARVIVFQWFLISNSPAPAQATILLPPTTTVDVCAPYAHDNRYNFRILYDRVHSLVSTNAATPSETSIQFKKVFLKKIPKKNAQFQQTTTAGINHIFVMTLGDRATTVSTIEWNAKLNYSDVG